MQIQGREAQKESCFGAGSSGRADRTQGLRGEAVKYTVEAQ